MDSDTRTSIDIERLLPTFWILNWIFKKLYLAKPPATFANVSWGCWFRSSHWIIFMKRPAISSREGHRGLSNWILKQPFWLVFCHEFGKWIWNGKGCKLCSVCMWRWLVSIWTWVSETEVIGAQIRGSIVQRARLQCERIPKVLRTRLNRNGAICRNY